MKRFLSALSVSFLCALLILAIPQPARADIGPKPSVHITCAHAPGPFYATLLSEKSVLGPYQAWEEGADTNADDRWRQSPVYEVWKKFTAYKDPDGFFFLQELYDCTETNSFAWTYYPPDTCKVLLYFPETDTFYSSPVVKAYAFDSFFSVDLRGVREGQALLPVERRYDYLTASLTLLGRIILTTALELLVALLFRYRQKRQLLFLAAVNGVTQVLLYLTLFVVTYWLGPMLFWVAFYPLELLVFILEAVVYRKLLPRFSSDGAGHPVWYALCANGVSMTAGLLLARAMPRIFI